MAVQSTTTTAGLKPKQASYVHPTYITLQPIWQQLRDVREGIGGFLDGTYLIAHPREWQDYTSENPSVPTKKLKARRRLASYENFAATIIDALKTAITREKPIRRIGKDGEAESPIQEWWDDCDGSGGHIDDVMATNWDIAGTFGHVYLYLDRNPTPQAEEGEAQTAADQGLPFIRVYTPLDAWDWIVDDMGELTAIKFAELAPRNSLETPYKPGEVRIRIVDQEKWTLYDSKGAKIEEGEHKMGCLPVVPLFAGRRPLEPHVGASVLGDPKLHIDLYNLVSEVRELLRNQTFSILNIPLGTGPDAMTVEQAQTLMGSAKGTDNALFSGTAAQFIQADTSNIEAYHAELSRKLRTIYRLASLAWEADSKDAEAEGSLKLKREDMNQRLAGYADEMERAEYKLAELFYRATLGDSWEQRFEADMVTVKYPDTFDMTPFDQVIEQAKAAQSLGMPSVFLKELRKKLARKFEGMGDLAPAILEEVDKAIDAAPDDLTPAEQAQQRLDLTMQAMKQGATKEPKPPASPLKEARPAA